MMRAKTIVAFIIFLFFVSVSAGLKAQDCNAYFPGEIGSERHTENYDKKDKLSSSHKQKISNIVESDKGIEYHVEQWSYDKKGKETSHHDLVMHCKDGVFFVDMESYIDPAMFEGMQDMQVKVDSENLAIPADLSVGQKLDDGSIQVTGTTMGIPAVNINLTIYNRVVEAYESITSPAGTYDCYKISQDMLMKSVFKAEFKVIEWMAPGVGVVRSETYDSKGKSMGYSLLKEIK